MDDDSDDDDMVSEELKKNKPTRYYVETKKPIFLSEWLDFHCKGQAYRI